MGKPTHLADLLGPPMLVALAAGLFLVLPADVLDVLAGWTLTSIPVGMLIGRCALND